MTLGGFFSSGAKGITWPERPDAGRNAVSGVIETVHPPEPIIDLVTNQPTDKMQVRIVLKTEERDPTDPDDDGRRTLYVKSWMRGAVGQALTAAGVKEPEVGGTLAVQFTHLTPPDRPGLSPSKHFVAQYTKPAVTAGYFGTGAPAAAPGPVPAAAPPQQFTPPPAPPAPQPVPASPAAATQIPAAVGALVARPEAISEVAWASMDDATKATLAATLGGAAAAPAPY